MATMTIKEPCQSVTSVNGEESGGSGEEADKEPLVSTFVEAERSFEILLLLHGWWCQREWTWRSWNRTAVHSTFGKRQPLSSHCTWPTELTSFLDYFKN